MAEFGREGGWILEEEEEKRRRGREERKKRKRGEEEEEERDPPFSKWGLIGIYMMLYGGFGLREDDLMVHN